MQGGVSSVPEAWKTRTVSQRTQHTVFQAYTPAPDEGNEGSLVCQNVAVGGRGRGPPRMITNR